MAKPGTPYDPDATPTAKEMRPESDIPWEPPSAEGPYYDPDPQDGDGVVRMGDRVSVTGSVTIPALSTDDATATTSVVFATGTVKTDDTITHQSNHPVMVELDAPPDPDTTEVLVQCEARQMTKI